MTTPLHPKGASMGVLEILARVKALAGEWEFRHEFFTKNNAVKTLAGFAAADFKRLQTDIEKSLDEEAGAMFEEHQKAEEAKKEGSNAV